MTSLAGLRTIPATVSMEDASSEPISPNSSNETGSPWLRAKLMKAGTLLSSLYQL